MSAVDELVKKLREAFGEEVVPHNGMGVCSLLVYEQNLAMDYSKSAHFIKLFGRIGSAPDDGGQTLKELLGNNLFFEKTSGAVFCMESTHGDVCLWQDVPAEGLSVKSFVTLLQQFAVQMSEAKTMLQQRGAEFSTSPAEVNDAGGDADMSVDVNANANANGFDISSAFIRV